MHVCTSHPYQLRDTLTKTKPLILELRIQLNLLVEIFSYYFTKMELHNHVSGEEQYLFVRIAFTQIICSLTVFLLAGDIYKSNGFRAFADEFARILIRTEDGVNLDRSIESFDEEVTLALSVDYIRETVRQFCYAGLRCPNN